MQCIANACNAAADYEEIGEGSHFVWSCRYRPDFLSRSLSDANRSLDATARASAWRKIALVRKTFEIRHVIPQQRADYAKLASNEHETAKAAFFMDACPNSLRQPSLFVYSN